MRSSPVGECGEARSNVMPVFRKCSFVNRRSYQTTVDVPNSLLTLCFLLFLCRVSRAKTKTSWAARLPPTPGSESTAGRGLLRPGPREALSERPCPFETCVFPLHTAAASPRLHVWGERWFWKKVLLLGGTFCQKMAFACILWCNTFCVPVPVEVKDLELEWNEF